jgi:glutamate-1-semialdehyde aminotransferase/acyl carrier protein
LAAQIASAFPHQERINDMAATQVVAGIALGQRDRVVALLKSVFEQMAGVQSADIDADKTFTELGADSLFLLQASQAIRDKFGVKVPFRTMLEEYPTIHALATYIDGKIPAYVESLSASEPAHTVLEPAVEDLSSGIDDTADGGTASPALPIDGQYAAGEKDMPRPTMPLGTAEALGSEILAISRSVAPGTIVERILGGQLRLLSEQLEILRQRYVPVGAAAARSASRPSVPKPASVAVGGVRPDRLPAPPREHGRGNGLSHSNGNGSHLKVFGKGVGKGNGKGVGKEIGKGAPQSNGHGNGVPARGIREESPKSSLMRQPSSLDYQFEPKPFVAHEPIEKGSTLGLNPRQREYLTELIASLTERTKGSKQFARDYRFALADNRSTAGFRLLWKELQYPLAVQKGLGARLIDADGNEYVDVAMGFGALLFGHSPSFVVEALHQQVDLGLRLGAASDLAGQAAQLICEMTGAERVTFCNSGTEAIMSALRLARTVTGRSKIALFEGCYHGTFDEVMVRGQKTADGWVRAVPMAAGTTRQMVDNVLLLKFNDPKSLDIIKYNARDLAAVLTEPLPSRRPDLQPKWFLQELRELTQEASIPLIFDEVVTGFRLHRGGAQGLYGVHPDLVTYGKTLGGGVPVAAVAGRAAYMDAIDGGEWNYGDDSYPQAETTFIAGTYFMHPLLMPAVLAVLKHIRAAGPELHDRLAQRAAHLAATLNRYFQQDGVPIRVAQFASLFRFVPHRDMRFMDLFYYHLLKKGVYICETRSCFLSTAHTDHDIHHIVKAVQETIVEMRAGDMMPRLSDASLHKNQAAAALTVAPFNGRSGPSGKSEAPALNSISPGSNPRSAASAGHSRLPLTEAQKAIWALSVMDEDAARAYHESSTLSIRGPLDLAAIRKAITALVDRHEALRITVGPEGDYQQVHSHIEVEVPLIDFCEETADRDRTLKDWLATEVRSRFDLTRGPLFRARVVKLEDQYHMLVLTIHHIVVDGWSNGILQQELADLYSAECLGISGDLDAPAQFSEYVRWLTAEQNDEVKESESYWLEQFRGTVPLIELPCENRPDAPAYAGAREQVALDPILYTQLKELSARSDTTLFTVLLAGFNLLMHRLSRQNDLIVGIHSAGQLAMGARGIVGHCVNLLPLRSRLQEDDRVGAYLNYLKQTLLRAYEHQNYPLARLVKNLGLPRDSVRFPLVSVVFNLDKVQSGSPSAQASVEVASNAPGFLQWELSMNMIELNDRLLMACDYKTSLFDRGTIRLWMSQFELILKSLASDPALTVTALGETLDQDGRRRLSDEQAKLQQARLQKFTNIRGKAAR